MSYVRKTKKKSNAGRKLFDGKPEAEVVQKLKQAFALGATDERACVFAEVSPAAFYEYQKKHPLFLESKRRLKEMPVLLALKTVVDALKYDPATARWYLSKKWRSEFGDKLELEGGDPNKPIVIKWKDKPVSSK